MHETKGTTCAVFDTTVLDYTYRGRRSVVTILLVYLNYKFLPLPRFVASRLTSLFIYTSSDFTVERDGKSVQFLIEYVRSSAVLIQYSRGSVETSVSVLQISALASSGLVSSYQSLYLYKPSDYKLYTIEQDGKSVKLKAAQLTTQVLSKVFGIFPGAILLLTSDGYIETPNDEDYFRDVDDFSGESEGCPGLPTSIPRDFGIVPLVPFDRVGRDVWYIPHCPSTMLQSLYIMRRDGMAWYIPHCPSNQDIIPAVHPVPLYHRKGWYGMVHPTLSLTPGHNPSCPSHPYCTTGQDGTARYIPHCPSHQGIILIIPTVHPVPRYHTSWNNPCLLSLMSDK